MKERRKAFRENEKRELILVVEHFLRILEGLVRQKEKKERGQMVIGPGAQQMMMTIQEGGGERII